MAREIREFVGIDTKKAERIKRSIPDSDSSQRMAEIFRVLADPTRLRIVAALESEELSVCDIALLTGSAQSLVSHHLQNLRQLNLVKYRRDGKMSFYSLSDSHVRAMLSIARDHIREND